MNLAQSLSDFGLTEGLLHIVRIIAAVGGAVVGWFVTDPLTRLGYRLWYQAATPAALLFTMKASAAAILATAIYLFMPLGGGTGGLGWGPGQGGGPGKGPGEGGGKDADIKDKPSKDAKAINKDDKSADPKNDQKREPIEIEILGSKRFIDDGKMRYYHLKPKDSSLSFPELRDYFSQNKGRLLVKITLTADSVSFGNEEDDPTRRLRRLMDTYEQNRDPKSND